MKTHTTTVMHTFELEGLYLEVPLKVEYHIENDGIGSYEYWGSPQYDAGQDYCVVDNITWNPNAYPSDINAELKEYLEDPVKYDETVEILATVLENLPEGGEECR